jgi:hypothetical protein
MGLASRAAVLTTTVVATATLLLSACSGSIADSDRPAPPRADRAPGNPFCAAVEANSAATRPLSGLRAGSGAEFATLAAEVRRTNTDVLATAPGEIRADVEIALAVAELQLTALEASGGDPAAAARDPELSERIAAPDYTSARQRVQDYVEANCGPAGRDGRG